MSDTIREQLSASDYAIFIYAAAYNARNGYGPSEEEIMLVTGVSLRTVQRSRSKLTDLGLIKVLRRYEMSEEGRRIGDDILTPLDLKEATNG